MTTTISEGPRGAGPAPSAAKRFAQELVRLHGTLTYRGLIDALQGEPLCHFDNYDDGLTTATFRQRQLPERYLRGVLGFRLAQFLQVGLIDPELIYRSAMFHEPLVEATGPDTIHTVTLTKTGQIVGYYLDRISALDPTVGAFVTVTEELALGQAQAAERKLAEARTGGKPLGPLHGVPVAVKDVARIEDVRCTQGSTMYDDDEIADIDDHVVTRMKDAGLVILGTTNTPEFALPCYTENRVGPPTRNPWSLKHSPGGSSGGSAAAVAARMVPLAHGTDAGGSVRIPASACGVVGIKPSRGRVSNGPVAHDVTGLSAHGALGRSATDAAALLEVMSGIMPGDAYTAPWSVRPPERPDERRALRIVAIPEPMVPGVAVHPDCLEAVDRATKLLVAAGHSIEEMEMSADQGVADAFARVWSVHASLLPTEEAREDELMPFTRYMRDLGRDVRGVDLYAALTTFRGVGQMLADMFFEPFDVILTPTLASPPPLIGEFTSDPDERANYEKMSAFMPYTPLYNLAGLPAVSLPLHWNDDGLPIGAMLGTRYGEEAKLVALAAELETAAGQLSRVPGALVG